MDWFHAILLGFLQGATEFLPISSSGHLVLAEKVLAVTEAGLVFDVALHLGTLAGLLVYFRRDFLEMGRAFRSGPKDERALFSRQMAFYICLGTLPAVAAGLLFGSEAETSWRSPLLIAFTLSSIGFLLLVADRKGKRTRDFLAITLGDILIIGMAQAVAIVPGVSRSGITITAGLFLGLKRTAATRFSFLLSAPVILGAGVYNLSDIIRQGLDGGMIGFYGAGFLAAAVSGYVFIAFLLQFVQTRSLAPFAYYRFGLAALVFLMSVIQ
jgi:undecaprenyl-diphosphatase